MKTANWDDPAVEERWCSERRQSLTYYLAKEGLNHGEVGSWPAWHVTPYISLWAVESLVAPGHVGWWVICGDLPTDYLSAGTVKYPKQALLAFADSWKEVALYMRSGVPHPNLRYGPPELNLKLAASLEERSELLHRLAEDDSLWGAEYD